MTRPVSRVAFVGDWLSRVSEIGAAMLPLSASRGASIIELCEELASGRGEATGLALARRILDRFNAAEAEERREFFSALAERFGVEPAQLSAAVEAWREEPSDDARARALHFASEPRSLDLIRLLNRAPGGTASLVAMRSALLRAAADDAALSGLDADFRHLFSSWFNRGFLQLERIDWSTPAAILEKIIAYEAVHEISGWDDLRRRVAAPDRRLYAFFHPALSGEPLIFVEVALTAEIPDAIGPVLAETRGMLTPESATTATFYSISNCQTGLRGISFGAFLIKQVVEDLRAELPGLRSFVTLSPMPGFRAWAEDGATLLPEDDRAGLEGGDPATLARAAAIYLAEAKSLRGGPVDPVARFHLGNGAQLHRINPGADAGARAAAESWGVMVNYLYDLDAIEKNHEAFAGEGRIATSPAVRRLLARR